MPRPVVLASLLALVLPVARPAGADDEPKKEEPKKVESSLVFLTRVELLPAVIETDPFVAWVKPILTALDARYAEESKPRTVVIQVTLHPDRPAEVEVAGEPALSVAERKAVMRLADPARAPRSKVVDCAFRLVAQVNGGAAGNGPMGPALLPTPAERRATEYQNATTAEKLVRMKRWGRAEALPLLAAFARSADPKFEGVRNLGKALGGVKPEGPIDVEALTDRNPDYWRALLEMVPDDPLVPAVRVALHTANGEVRRARSVLGISAPFGSGRSPASALLGDFRALFAPFDKEVQTRIREGIALNDRGEFAEALKVFDDVLRQDPESPWALYERFHTRQEQALKEHGAEAKLAEGWPEVRKAILDADPLYSSMAVATGPGEVYDLLLRKEIETLFKDRTRLVKDLLRYADIALDLGQPGFAAPIYWQVLTRAQPSTYGDRNLIEDFLYCLEHLGVTGLKENFKGDHAAEFRRIDAERARRKRESSAFRNFTDPKPPEPDPAPRDR